MRSKLLSIKYIILLIFLFNSCSVSQDRELTEEDKAITVERISKLMNENYVFPDIASEAGQHLKQLLEKGEFDSYTDPYEFARVLTDELYKIAGDKHLRVRYRNPDDVQREENDPFLDRYYDRRRMLESNYGFIKAEILDGNVGYLKFNMFSGAPEAQKTAMAIMKYLSNTDAVIFDLRENGGGSPDMVQLLCSYFFDEPTHLNSLYWRVLDDTQEFWTREDDIGKRMPDVPLYVLTSSYTFSGAEEFTYNMQTRKRAVIVGETTGGGANPGGTMNVNEKFRIFIPTGRAINPVTGTNWEGTGITPDVQVSKADAFNKAYELALADATARQKKLEDEAKQNISSLNDLLKKGETAIKNGDYTKGEKLVFQALESGLAAGILSEGIINYMGYDYLRETAVDMAVAVFTYNTVAFPDSYNVWDSLAEAYMLKGDDDNAITNYKKSLEINPDNDNAVRMIEKLQK